MGNSIAYHTQTHTHTHIYGYENLSDTYESLLVIDLQKGVLDNVVRLEMRGNLKSMWKEKWQNLDLSLD